jgi:predicted kinase
MGEGVRQVLVLLNGIPASGKSTLAREWCARRAPGLPLALDIDVLRGMLGGWRERRTEAGLAARSMAIAAIRTHLLTGHDVLVPQYVRRPEFVDELAATAQGSSAAFLECALLTDQASALGRFATRSADAADHGRPDDEGELDEPADAIEEAFTRFLQGRPDAVPLDADASDLIDQLDRAIARARSS